MTHSETGAQSAKRSKGGRGVAAKSVIGRISATYDPRKGRFEYDSPNDLTAYVTRCIETLSNDDHYDIKFILDVYGFADFPAQRFPEDGELRRRVEDQIRAALARLIAGNHEAFVADDINNRYLIGFVNSGCNVSEGSPDDERRKTLDTLFAGLPDDPKVRLNAVVALQRDFRRNAAKYLQPVINTLLREAPPASFVEKQALSAEINAAMHELGLGICRVEATQPQGVTATRSQGVQTGWLRLQHRKKPPEGEKRISAPTTELGELRLIEAIREEPLQGRR